MLLKVIESYNNAYACLHSYGCGSEGSHPKGYTISELLTSGCTVLHVLFILKLFRLKFEVGHSLYFAFCCRHFAAAVFSGLARVGVEQAGRRAVATLFLYWRAVSSRPVSPQTSSFVHPTPYTRTAPVLLHTLNATSIRCPLRPLPRPAPRCPA